MKLSPGGEQLDAHAIIAIMHARTASIMAELHEGANPRGPQLQRARACTRGRVSALTHCTAGLPCCPCASDKAGSSCCVLSPTQHRSLVCKAHAPPITTFEGRRALQSPRAV